MSEQDWQELATDQWDAASLGGSTWRRFVRECEQRLGRPWVEIRTRFEVFYKAGLCIPPRYRQ